jgi:hypothetical protein
MRQRIRIHIMVGSLNLTSLSPVFKLSADQLHPLLGAWVQRLVMILMSI